MPFDDFEDQISDSFGRVKEDVKTLENDVISLKNVILKQNELIREISERVVAFQQELLDLKKAFFVRSTGNDGVKRASERASERASDQALSTELSTSSTQTDEKPVFDEDFKGFKVKLSRLFKDLSKQELKTFLTIYQLEDEKIEPSHLEIALKMGLSENCVRAYVANLMKKGAPIIKKKTNNTKSTFFVHPEFRTLNMKDQLVKFYYADPYQTTLFHPK